MVRKLLRRLTNRNPQIQEIDPDEIFLDSSNLPEFDRNQMEGRMEKPITAKSVVSIALVFLVIGFLFVTKLFSLQVVHGAANLQKADNNTLHQTAIFAERGLIYDRNNTLLAWNVPNPDGTDFSLRQYATTTGLAHVLGYVKYPQKDSSGFYYQEALTGIDGVESYFDKQLSGQNGLQIVETNAVGKVQSESTINPPVNGTNLVLSIDAGLQSELNTQIANLAAKAGFLGGAGVIMDVHTGQVLAMTSYPEFSPQVMTDGTDAKAIDAYNSDPEHPFLDKVISGLYTPGSIVKPVMATGVLEQHIIDPNKQILSTGQISIQNPYDPTQSTIFRDWKALGWLDIRHAIAMSSDVFFYEVGGGYQDQPGLGIANIDKYLTMFGYGQQLPPGFFQDKAGTISSPAWKAANFNGEQWYLGDTYHTAIGQYGTQVTPIQVVRAIAAIANGGTLVNPTIINGDQGSTVKLPVDPANLEIVREGMRLGVTEGISQALNLPGVEFASKTGTAELGVTKDYVNSWATGFFPYSNPKYAYAIIMESGSRNNLTGAIFVMNGMIPWMQAHTPQYLQ